MEIAATVAVVVTSLALWAVLGHPRQGSLAISQLIVYALPIPIAAFAYAAANGMNLAWAIGAALAAAIGIVISGVLGAPKWDIAQPENLGAASVVVTAGMVITIGLGLVGVLWATELIGAFSFLNLNMTSAAMLVGAIGVGLGTGAMRGLSRIVLVGSIVCAIGMLVLGFFLGAPAGLTSPLVPAGPVPPLAGLGYLAAIVVIAIAYPVLRNVGTEDRSRVAISGVIASLICLTIVIGILMLYGGAFTLPSLVINVFPVYSPTLLSMVLCAGFAAIGAGLGGVAIRRALADLSHLLPSLGREDAPAIVARRMAIAAVVIAAAMYLLAVLAPSPSWIVGPLSLLAVGSLVAEVIIARNSRRVNAAA